MKTTQFTIILRFKDYFLIRRKTNFRTKNANIQRYSIINKMFKSALLIGCILLSVSSLPMIEKILIANSLSLDPTAQRYWDCDPCDSTNRPTSSFFVYGSQDSQFRADSFLSLYQNYTNPFGGTGKVNFGVINFVYVIQDERLSARDFEYAQQVPSSVCPGCGIQLALAQMTKNMEPTIRQYLDFLSFKKIKTLYLTGNGAGGSLAQAFFPIINRISNEKSYGLSLNMSVFSPVGVGNAQWINYVLNTYGHTRVFYFLGDQNEAFPYCQDADCNQLKATGDIFYCSEVSRECVSERYQLNKQENNLKKDNMKKEIIGLLNFSEMFKKLKSRILTDNLQKYRLRPRWNDVRWFIVQDFGLRYIRQNI